MYEYSKMHYLSRFLSILSVKELIISENVILLLCIFVVSHTNVHK